MRPLYFLLPLLWGCSLLDCNGGLSEEERGLRDAIQRGDTQDAQRRLDEGADPQAAESWGLDPRELVRGEPSHWLGSYLKYHQLLWIALYSTSESMCPPSESSSPETLSELGEALRGEASRLVLTMSDVTALHTAAFFCRPDIARLLIERGADLEATDGSGLTPLHWVTCAEVAHGLIDAGANVNARSNSLLTPLSTAIEVGVAEVLLDHGADLEAVDNCGNTPLHFAYSAGLHFPSEQGLDLEIAPETPPWARLLYRLIEDTDEIARLLASRFDVAGALESHGANRNARNHTGHRPSELLGVMGSGHDD